MSYGGEDGDYEGVVDDHDDEKGEYPAPENVSAEQCLRYQTRRATRMTLMASLLSVL